MTVSATSRAPAPLLASMAEVRRMLGDIGRDAVYELAARGEITSTKVGGRRLFFVDSVAAYVARLREDGPVR
jgi:excisionase family DNA binding protein